MRITTCLIVAGLAVSLSAQNTRKGVFITPDQLDLTAILPNPPADTSWKTMAELADLHRIQETRTPEQIAHAKKDDVEEHIFIFNDVLGQKFNREALPQTALLSDHLHNDEGVMNGVAKGYFKRLRPFNLDATLKPVCKATANRADYGFPSGHGTTGYLEALALIQIVPEKRDAILARADDYAYSREVCGVHYGTDEDASKVVAYAMMGIIMSNSQFKKELQAARRETRAALGLEP